MTDPGDAPAAASEPASRNLLTRIVAAAERSLAHEFIRKLPGGYDQVLGKRFRTGVDLSGGDWQKIAYLSWDRARSGRTDGALVRFTAPIFNKDEEAADRQIRELASEILPGLAAYVPEG